MWYEITHVLLNKMITEATLEYTKLIINYTEAIKIKHFPVTILILLICFFVVRETPSHEASISEQQAVQQKE